MNVIYTPPTRQRGCGSFFFYLHSRCWAIWSWCPTERMCSIITIMYRCIFSLKKKEYLWQCNHLTDTENTVFSFRLYSYTITDSLKFIPKRSKKNEHYFHTFTFFHTKCILLASLALGEKCTAQKKRKTSEAIQLLEEPGQLILQL